MAARRRKAVSKATTVSYSRNANPTNYRHPHSNPSSPPSSSSSSSSSPVTSSVFVAVRVRPLNPREQDTSPTSTIAISPHSPNTFTLTDPTALTAINQVSQSLNLPHTTTGEGSISPSVCSRPFSFDYVYSSSSQAQIYSDLGVKVLQNAWQGHNCSVFAYGQTGAGKSYTMMGTGGPLDASIKEDDYGLIPRICCGLFNSVQRRLEEQVLIVVDSDADADVDVDASVDASVDKFEIGVSYVEIYNETLKDLLVNADENSPKNDLKVREHPTKGSYVEGLSLIPCLNYKEVNGVLLFGGKQRTTSSTRANARSSRSHAIFTIIFKQITGNNFSKTTLVSKINLIDLAGSERVKVSPLARTPLTTLN